MFLGLAALPVLFVRLRQRRLKIAALVLGTPPSVIVASVSIPGSWELPGLLFFAALSVFFVLTPALLDMKMGRERVALGRVAQARLTEL